MNCRTAEGMVNRYINHTLSVEQLEEFLDHIQECSSCYDELATYFIVHEAIQQLNESGSESVLDFKELLQQDIKKSRRYISRKKASRFFSGILVFLLIMSLAAFMIYVIMETIHIL